MVERIEILLTVTADMRAEAIAGTINIVLAKAGLALALERCRELGMDRVLVTCDDDNIASYRTIEGAGGVLENVVETGEAGAPAKRRYWIQL